MSTWLAHPLVRLLIAIILVILVAIIVAALGGFELDIGHFHMGVTK